MRKAKNLSAAAQRRAARARAHARGLTSRREVLRFVKRSLAAHKGWQTRREHAAAASRPSEEAGFEFGASVTPVRKELKKEPPPAFEDEDTVIVEDPVFDT